MDTIILYTTHCPKCNVLKAKLDEKNISYQIVDDIETLKTLGFNFFPLLKINNGYYEFKAAVDWVNKH